MLKSLGRLVRVGTATCAVLFVGGALTAQAATPNRYANVSAAGALLSGSAVSGVVRLNVGQYEVTFTSNVSGCAYVATTVKSATQALQVFTAGGHLSANGVYVETKNQGGGLTDGPFNLVVSCGGTTAPFAVVGYANDLVRSSPGATLTPLGAGRYNVTFASAVKNCAYIATVGDPAAALVYNPAGVYTGSSTAGIYTVYVETKNAAGGLQSGVPFHLVAFCGLRHSYRAVVDPAGIIKRGSPFTSSFRIATGQYIMVTNANIMPSCAVVATRGSINTGVPFNPTTIEIAGGPAPNTAGLELKELLFFGGNLFNEAFHVVAVCP